MEFVAGVDVGNNSTEVAIGMVDGTNPVRFVSSALVGTVGIKGNGSQCFWDRPWLGPGSEIRGNRSKRSRQNPA